MNRFKLPLRFRRRAACFSCCSSTSVIQQIFLPHISRCAAHTMRRPITGQHSLSARHTSARFLHAFDKRPLQENNDFQSKSIQTYDAIENSRIQITNDPNCNLIFDPCEIVGVLYQYA